MTNPSLVVGERYLCGLPPFGMTTVVYLGPVPLLKNWIRVQDFLTGRTLWVRTKAIKPLLISLHGGQRSEP